MKRVKTLGQLAAEFGDRLHLFGEGMIAVSDTGPTDVAVYITELGKPFIDDQDWSPSDIWRKTFLQKTSRRFKTNEELIASNYSDIWFNCYGVVNVKHMGLCLTKTTSDTPEGIYPDKWLEVFTTTVEEDA